MVLIFCTILLWIEDFALEGLWLQTKKKSVEKKIKTEIKIGKKSYDLLGSTRYGGCVYFGSRLEFEHRKTSLPLNSPRPLSFIKALRFFLFELISALKRPAMGGLTPKKVVPRMPAEWSCVMSECYDPVLWSIWRLVRNQWSNFKTKDSCFSSAIESESDNLYKLFGHLVGSNWFVRLFTSCVWSFLWWSIVIIKEIVPP